jgi:hypothetical protein
MRILYTALLVGVIATLVATAGSIHAQQVTVGTPFRTLQDHFFESNSINWSGSLGAIPSTGGPVVPYLNFSYGGGALSRPQFGSPQLGAGLSTNFAILSKNAQINFGLNFSQGYTQSATTQTPSVTLTNGQTGYVSDTSQTPFVISVVPVVGAFPTGPQQLQQLSGIDPAGPDPRIQAILQAHFEAQALAAAKAQAAAAGAQVQAVIPPPPQPQGQNNVAPQRDPKPMNARQTQGQANPAQVNQALATAAADRLSAAQESSAGRPAVSVAEAKRLHEQELAQGNGEMEALMERARALEEDGKPNVAKIYYQRVAKHASGELQQQARTRLYELQGAK